MQLLEKIKTTINKYRLIDKKDKVLIAVSGGPDSVALLYLLNSLKKELGLSLYIAHLDHMLRKDSSRDAEFVESLAEKLRIPFRVSKINVKELSRRGSLEEAARNARLGFLLQVASQIGADKIATGHNLDDQAETVLMRLLRGAGLYGLSAILPKRNFSGFWIIRPLIETRRKDIELFLRKRGVRPRQDPSNFKNDYLRNKIRHRLLPQLEKGYNKNIKEALSRVAESSGLDYDYLFGLANSLMRSFEGRINLQKFLRLHPAMQRLVLRLNIARLKGDTRKITFQHIREIEDLIFSRPANSIVDLPKGISVIKKKDYLCFYSSK